MLHTCVPVRVCVCMCVCACVFVYFRVWLITDINICRGHSSFMARPREQSTGLIARLRLFGIRVEPQTNGLVSQLSPQMIRHLIGR